MTEILKKGLYRHYKGNVYEVLGIAKHAETLEPLVIYKSIDDLNLLWVRPLEMFLSMVHFNGTEVPRFLFVQESI